MFKLVIEQIFLQQYNSGKDVKIYCLLLFKWIWTIGGFYSILGEVITLVCFEKAIHSQTISQ